MKKSTWMLSVVLMTSALAVGAANAQLITNGDFETGDFTGWTTNVEPGSGGGLFVVPNDGSMSPVTGIPYQLNPTGGGYFAITDASAEEPGPGSYSLTQSFTLTAASIVKISFQLFTNNLAGLTYANGRDYNFVPNQNAEVDILTGSADPFTVSPSDIVSVLYGPGTDLGDIPNPWTSYSDTLSLAAGAYQLRFAETDNQGFLQMGVDNVSVSLMTGIPESSTWTMLLMAFGGFGFVARYRARKTGTVDG